MATTAPCTAEIDPTADSTGAQSSSFTTALVTVSNGIGGLAEIIVKICKPLIIARTTNSPNTAKMALTTFLVVGFIAKNLDAAAFATSCIRWFVE